MGPGVDTAVVHCLLLCQVVLRPSPVREDDSARRQLLVGAGQSSEEVLLCGDVDARLRPFALHASEVVCGKKSISQDRRVSRTAFR